MLDLLILGADAQGHLPIDPVTEVCWWNKKRNEVQ